MYCGIYESTKAAEARGHGIEALEYLSQIVEVRRTCTRDACLYGV